jgi:hypothetical protein
MKCVLSATPPLAQSTVSPSVTGFSLPVRVEAQQRKWVHLHDDDSAAWGGCII